MNKNNDNKIKLTFHPAEFGAKMPIPLAEQSVKAGFPSPAQDYMEGEIFICINIKYKLNILYPIAITRGK